jgi:uncharacterized membrane protein
MIKKHKWKAIISSVIILLPILFGVIMWHRLPANMVSHWGADGVADGTASKAFMVFGVPLILLALQWLMLLAETFLQKQKQQNEKIVAITYGIIPVISLAVHVFIYSVALEKNWDLSALLPVLIGGLFLYIGNYLPKTTRNRTMGIKLRWTMGNDENWQKTHRLGGRLWFWGGLAIVISALLPIQYAIGVMIVMILVATVVPAVYSYGIYKKHKAQGIQYEPVFDRKSDKLAIWITAVVVPLILVGVTVLMLTGDIQVTFGEQEFQIVADYADDLTVSYRDIDTVEYRESFEAGSREMGFGSPHLSTGTFENAEFGRYTLYAYTNGEGAVVLKKGEKTLVIVGKNAEETKMIYETLKEKVQ